MSHAFEIIASDVFDKAQHKISVIYYSGNLILLEQFVPYLLLAGRSQLEKRNGAMETFTLLMEPGLSIAEYLPIPILN